MFDLTKEIQLDDKWQKIYNLSRIVVYLFFFLGIIYFFYLIIFPSQNFIFLFKNPDSSNNNITDPRNENGDFPEEGKIKADSKLIFDANTAGNFSRAKFEINLANESPQMEKIEVLVRKSYKAFFYPLGEPLGFKEGSLIKNNNNYYIASKGKIRRFFSEQIAQDMGYDIKSFKEAGDGEIQQSEKGNEIALAYEYPQGTLFKIAGNFYQLINNELIEFASDRAFQSQYDSDQAIEKNEEFLKTQSVGNNLLGFSDGSLLSFDEAVFLISGNKVFPFADPQTFESAGYLWENVIPATRDEMSIYEKSGIFYVHDPHPDGTVFFARDTGKYYYIQDSKKSEIKGTGILNSYKFSNPIETSEGSSTEISRCSDRKAFLFFKVSGCEFSLANLQKIPGNNYQFEVRVDKDIQVESLNAVFKKTISWNNTVMSLGNIKNKLINDYYGKGR